MAALGGGTAGILGLTSLYGFVFYLFCTVALWVSDFNRLYLIFFSLTELLCLQLFLLIKAGPEWEKYFTSRRSLLTNGLTSGLIVSFFYYANFTYQHFILKIS